MNSAFRARAEVLTLAMRPHMLTPVKFPNAVTRSSGRERS
jgi:hypothetical protein